MSFLSCEEMLAAARSQKITLAEAVLRSDLEESRLTEEQSRAAMHHLWQVMQATSREYDPAQRSRSGLSGGDAAKVEQAHKEGKLLGGDYLSAVTAEALKTAECNACMKRIVAAPTAGSCGVLPAVLLPLARAGEADEEAVCEALYVAAGFGQVIAARATLAGAEGGCQAEVGAASAMAAAALCSLKGGTPEQCAAAAALTGDNRQNRHLHIRHFKEVAGNCLALASLLCLHTRECTWRIDKTDDRTVKFRRLFHQTERLSVSFRRRHAEVVLHAVFRGFTSLLSNDCDRHSIERCHTADDRHIIAIIPVAVELGKIVKQDPDIIAGVQTSGATGLAYCLPGVSLSTCDLI